MLNRGFSICIGDRGIISRRRSAGSAADTQSPWMLAWGNSTMRAFAGATHGPGSCGGSRVACKSNNPAAARPPLQRRAGANWFACGIASQFMPCSNAMTRIHANALDSSHVGPLLRGIYSLTAFSILSVSSFRHLV